ncbi:MAG: flavodoxin domain-containing protein [Candidatus Bathyarchaeota archaeon]|nr:MAG: flavodoxin domain-containing protein [Candidatus Bathyarchaeota archaeon]
MKTLVAYYSQTGNTEKVARAIYEEASRDHEAYLEKIEDITADTLNEYDLVFLGSACHSSDLATPVKEVLDAISDSPKFKLAGFFTHATSSGGFNKWASKCVLSFQEASRVKKITFIGYYNCQGVPAPLIQEFIKSEVFGDSLADWEGYFEEVRKHPSLEDLQKAREFARRTISHA